MGNIVQILIQLVSGAVGGNAAGKAAPKLSLGNIGNTIVGLLGGLGGSQLLGALNIGSGDVGSIIASILGGGVGGGLLTVIAGFVKNLLAKK